MTQEERDLNTLLRTWSSHSVMDTEQLEMLQRLVEESRTTQEEPLIETTEQESVTTEAETAPSMRDWVIYTGALGTELMEQTLNSSLMPELASLVNDDEIIQQTLEAVENALRGETPSESEQEESFSEDLSTEEEEVLEEVIKTSVNIPEALRPVLIEDTTSRFSGAIWYEKIQSLNVTLAGVGGIGSYVAFLLSRLKIESLTMYDPDRVEAVNMSGQLFKLSNIGGSKVNAMALMAQEYSEYYLTYTIADRYTRSSPSTPIMICGFDNMEARKVYFRNWRDGVFLTPEEERKECLFIDGRLAAEEFQVFCIRGDDNYNIDRYERDFLFHDSEAEPTVCSYKQTTFMANMIGSVIVNLFVNFAANLCDPVVERDMPFLTEYNAETMYFNTVR